MEKIIYPVWKHETESSTDFRQKLLGKVSEQLIRLGVYKLRISVVDDDVARWPVGREHVRVIGRRTYEGWGTTSQNSPIHTRNVDATVDRVGTGAAFQF